MQAQAQAQVQFDETLWVGNSAALQSMRETLWTLGDTQLPVLISGSNGTGKSIAAQTIHDSNLDKNRPLVIACCKRWTVGGAISIMDDIWAKAKGGTLFLRNVDTLEPADAHRIKDYWLRAVDHPDSVRLIAGISETKHSPSHPFHINHNFVEWLHYHCLTVELKSLAQRAEDIESLVAHFGQQDNNIAALSFHPSGWGVFKSYQWPGNVKQLKRCLDKLAVLARDEVVCDKVLCNHFPSMSQSVTPLLSDRLAEYQAHLSSGVEDINLRRAPVKLSIVEPPASEDSTGDTGAAITNEDREMTGHHPALDKAVSYLCRHYKTAFSMAELAGHACVSPSHLSFLFKRYLGQSFKQILLRLRVAEAVRLLSAYPNRQVTHVCDDVGFSDLSFFERKFKAMVGVSPGVYRDQYGQSSR